MPTPTTDQGLILPLATDADNVPLSMTAYNGPNSVESRLVKRYLSVADRTARNPAPTEGELSYLLDINRYEYYTGAAWLPLVTGAFVGETTRIVSSAGFTTTETVLDTVTFVAETATRYEVKSVLSMQSTVAADTVQIRFRWQAGAVLTTAGTEFGSVLPNMDIAGRGGLQTIIRTITGLSGQVTVGTTAVRDGGTGTISSFGTAKMVNYIVVTSL